MINNDKPIKVEGIKDGSKVAKSAEAAVREIEEKAQELNKQDNVYPNILRIKDPQSRFITAQDVLREKQLLNAGLTLEVNRSIKAKKGKVLSSKPGHDRMRSLLENARQSCPVCSLELASPYPMEWIDSAEMFRCVRCTMEIHPFAIEDEPLPEEPTNFGLSAIHDISPALDDMASIAKKFPLVSRKKKISIYDVLDKRKEDNTITRKLGRKIG